MGEVKELSPPELLADHHDITGFSSGEATLDDWLARRARANLLGGASRTYVVCHDNRVIAVEAASGRFRRNMPNPIPVAVLARLAVDKNWQGHGIGRVLFRDAAHRVEQAADVIGIRGIVVHAISDRAQRFYLALGFTPSPHDPMTLMVTLPDVRDALA